MPCRVAPTRARKSAGLQGIEPTPERLSKGDLTLPGGSGVRAYRTEPAWQTLADAGRLTGEQAGLCERYADAVILAGLDRMRLASLEGRVDGAGRGDLPERIVTARTLVLAWETALRNRHPRRLLQVARVCCAEGHGTRAAERMLGMDRRTVCAWIARCCEMWQKLA